jgi:FdhE protein
VSHHYTWDERIERAEHLQKKYSSSAELLAFYVQVAQFQKRLYEELGKSGNGEIALIADAAPELLALVRRAGPSQMVSMARNLEVSDWRASISQQWGAFMNGDGVPADFFVRALLQPYAEAIAWNTSNLQSETCPFCKSKPQLIVLRPEGEGAKRYLYCDFCNTEWAYRRIICANCGELDKEALPTFRSEQLPQVHLAGCDSCRSYLKCIDLSVDGHAIPMSDDLASLSLSLWAVRENYRPVSFNLFGF